MGEPVGVIVNTEDVRLCKRETCALCKEPVGADQLTSVQPDC